jgi:RNA polymerase sigma-70 factor (ECF subfamily)
MLQGKERRSSLLKLAQPREPDVEARFLALYETYFVPIRRFIVRLSGDRQHAEDLAQEVFKHLWAELTSAAEPANTRAWLYRVASNVVVSGYRSRARALRFLWSSVGSAAPAAPSREDVEGDAARREMVERALATLPNAMRQCLLLQQEGLTGREIGDILNVNPSYVSTLIYRAHERFRRECDRVGGVDGLLR